MPRLILLRHARAEPIAVGGEDFDRPLTPGGRADAVLIGRVLDDHALRPDTAVVSAARRTTETWEGAAENFPAAAARLDRDLYHATADDWLAALEGETGTVLAVGHNPSIQDLAVTLAQRAAESPRVLRMLSERFPPATAAAFDLGDDGAVRLDGIFYVRDFGGDRR